MKKLLMFIVLVTFSVAQLTAQETTFNKGDKVVNVGIGLGSYFYSNFDLAASFEIGIVDNILEKGSVGVGGYVSFAPYKHFGVSETSVIIGPRGAFHYAFVDKLDTYAGLLIGYNIDSYALSAYDHIFSSGFAGARYYFSDNFAGNAEIGLGGSSILTVGIALKF